ncbi:FadR/GntR family transcriptional regulator [Pseudomonas oryzihabitans]|uniref:FadR/GntR family transcriptional regulator n=1 Tax=Pseudomonas oryzihabitans TaxID=47885 RepID=UPI001CC2A035|nr:FCD domain-containing protein [Pseudomonas oryzihabitans]
MSEAVAQKSVRADGARNLARYLVDEIESGRLAAGQKLPAERVLSETFQASRGSVRRVLSNLKDKGLITQTVGSGTFVAENVQLVLPVVEHAPASVQTSPAELMEARLLIETQMPSLIVRYATAADFAKMEECIVRSEAASTIAEFEHWDGALHQAFAEATHNSFFLKILELTTQIREEGEWGRLKKNSLTPERRRQYEEQHRAIVNALRDRDEQLSRELIEAHLIQVQRNLFGRD